MIATPLFSEMRYIYSVVLSAPAFFIMAIYNRDATPGKIHELKVERKKLLMRIAT